MTGTASNRRTPLSQPYPWCQGAIWIGTVSSLHEAVLRVDYMGFYAVREVASDRKRDDMLKMVARWRCGHGCSEDQWRTLVTLVGSHFRKNKNSQPRRHDLAVDVA